MAVEQRDFVELETTHVTVVRLFRQIRLATVPYDVRTKSILSF
jgi:hypothetical protein